MKKRSMQIATVMAVLTLQLVPLPAMAQRIGMVSGAGMTGCGEFLEDRKANKFKQIYTQWVAGYLSSYNLFSNRTAVDNFPDEATIDAYLQKHCRDKPLDNIVKATAFLLSDLGGFTPSGMK